MKRKTAPTHQATVTYQACPLKHVDKQLRKLAREWDGRNAESEYNGRFGSRSISFVFPTRLKRYSFIQKARKYLGAIEYGLCGLVQFK